MLEIKGISKSYGDNSVLNNISLHIGKGDILVILGTNGAGKSTLINILSCLIEPDKGDVFFDGENVKSNIDKYKNKIGIVPQEIALYQELSAYDNLMFWGGLYDISRKELQETADYVLNLFGLYDKRNAKIKTYSGGMKRKINIACSILHKPSLLLMDEPTVGLDPQSTNDTIDHIENLNAKGMTIVYTTHYMKVAERLCNRIALIDEGSILDVGSFAVLRGLSGIKDSVTIKLKNANSTELNKLQFDRSLYRIDNLNNTFHMDCEDINKEIADIIAGIQACNGEILSIDTCVADLESIFIKLTGKMLKD